MGKTLILAAVPIDSLLLIVDRIISETDSLTIMATSRAAARLSQVRSELDIFEVEADRFPLSPVRYRRKIAHFDTVILPVKFSYDYTILNLELFCLRSKRRPRCLYVHTSGDTRTFTWTSLAARYIRGLLLLALFVFLTPVLLLTGLCWIILHSDRRRSRQILRKGRSRTSEDVLSTITTP